MNLGELFVKIGVDEAPLTQGLAKATASIKTFSTGLEKAGAQVGDSLSKPLSGVAATATQAGQAIQGSLISPLSNLRKLSDAAGASLKGLTLPNLQVGAAASLNSVGAAMKSVQAGAETLRRANVGDIGTAISRGFSTAAGSVSPLLQRFKELGQAKFNGVVNSLEKISAAAGRAISSIRGLSIQGVNQSLNKGLDQMEKRIRDIGSGFERLGDIFQNAGRNLSIGLTAPLVLLGGASLKAAGDIQALERGFAAVYKGALPLADELAKVKEAAKLPGLGLKEAIKGSVNLQAAGYSADLARRALLGFGNALATVGKGKSDLDGVSNALSQIASKGKISAEEINQLAERVPQIRQIMKAAFGTADTEVLQKMGIGATDFVDKVVRELEKLPRVTGGINNAFENMGDGIFNGLAKVGDALNKTFNIEGLLNRIGDTVSDLGDAFAGMGPAGQAVVFALAGVAAAAGPMLLAVGGIIKLLPLLSVGMATIAGAFGAVVGPIGIAVAAIVAGGVLIYRNWDDIVNFIKSSGLADAFSNLANSVGGLLSPILQAFAALGKELKPLWDGIVAIIGTGLGEAIGLAAKVVVDGLNVVTQVFKIAGAVITGDFIGAFVGLQNLIAGVLNGVTGTVIKFVSGLIRTVGAISNLMPEGFGKEFAAGVERAAKEVERFGSIVKVNTLDVKGLNNELKVVGETATQAGRKLSDAFSNILAPKAINTSLSPLLVKENENISTQIGLLQRLGDQLEYWEGQKEKATNTRDLAKANQRIESINKEIEALMKLGQALPVGKFAKLDAELRQHQETLSQATTEKAVSEVYRHINAVNAQIEELKQFENAYKNIERLKPITLPAPSLDEKKPIKIATIFDLGGSAAFKKAVDAVFNPRVVMDATSRVMAQAQKGVEGFKSVFDDIVPPGLLSLPARFEEAYKPVVAVTKNFTAEVLDAWFSLQDQLETAITSLTVDTLGNFGEAWGAAFAGDTGAMESFFNNALMAMADFASEFGKYLIAFGVGKIALDSLFASGPIGGALAIAAGIALSAAAGAAKAALSKGPNFAGAGRGGGGTTYRPPQANAFREPQSAQDQEVVFRIRGADLEGILRKRSFDRTRSG